MLAPEVAKERLKVWEVDANADPMYTSAGTRFHKAIGKLPAPLARIAFGLFGCDAKGNSTGEEGFKKPNADKLRRIAGAEFDRLSRKDQVRLLTPMFPRVADLVVQTWEALQAAPYQTGYYAKAYRAPKHPDFSLASRLGWLSSLLDIAETYREEQLEPVWLATWAPYLKRHWQSWELEIGTLLATTIDAGGKVGDEVFDILCQSARNEHEIGGMGRHVARGLLLASREEGWELLEKMLLAAQRQEGLRQSILEAIDVAHPAAYRRMLRLVQEHDLARFSAVARAVNVWFGFAWDSASVRVINEIIDSALTMLDDPAARKQALAGGDAEAAYFALWASACEDAMASIDAAKRLLKHKAADMRFVALTHLALLGLKEAEAARWSATDDDDLRVALRAMEASPCSIVDALEEADAPRPDAFERLERYFARLAKKPVSLPAMVWPWTGMKIAQADLCPAFLPLLGDRPPTRLLPYLEAMDPPGRRAVAERFGSQKKWDADTRAALVGLAGDASADVRGAAFAALQKINPTDAEIDRLLELLSRKAADLRTAIIRLVLARSDAQVLKSADHLLGSKDGDQRLAGLELLRQLREQSREVETCRKRVVDYTQNRSRVTKDEQRQLDAIVAESSRTAELTLDNALGLMDPAQRTPVVPPRKLKTKLITPAAVACLKELDELVHQYRETAVMNNQQPPHEELLGTIDWKFPGPYWWKDREPQTTQLPLRAVWENWLSGRSQDCRDRDGLELLRGNCWQAFALDWRYDKWQKWTRRKKHRAAMLAPLNNEQPINLRYVCVVERVLDWLLFLHPPKSQAAFLLDAAETLAAAVPSEEIQALVPKAAAGNDRESTESDETPWYGTDWRSGGPIQNWLNWLNRIDGSLELDDRRRRWQIVHWLDRPVTGASRDLPDSDLLLRAYSDGHANLHDIADALLGSGCADGTRSESFSLLKRLTERRLKKEDQVFLEQNAAVRDLVERARATIVEAELTRGEAPTAATTTVFAVNSLIGTDTLVRLLHSLGSANFKAVDSWDEAKKVQRVPSLTRLVSITYPAPDDTSDEFVNRMRAAVAAGAFPEERLIELAFLAPQWTKFVEAYFAWEGLAEGLYWFLGHMRFMWGSDMGNQAAESADVDDEADEEAEQDSSEDSDDDLDSEPGATSGKKLSPWDRLIRERTALSKEEREDGAIDVMWFRRVYAALGPKRWQHLAQAAKFAANATQAKKAQLIADVLLGKAKLNDLIGGIEKRFLKDNVRLIGLYPLPEGAKREPELARRFKVLQDYARYAKQLSGLTKPQALRALEIGLKNLASTAGYADALRLDWALGASQWADLRRGPVSVSRDGVTVSLAIDAAVQPQIVVSRGDKELKTTPAAVKKHPPIAELFERGRELKRHASRQKQALEAAMCRGDEFSAGELLQLCQHALVAPFLERLVLVGEGVMGYPEKNGKALRDHAGKLEPIKKNERLRIAHPHDLYASRAWEAWHRECFQAERMQPFKQVFRELYVVTKQEKSTGDRSERYAGQQVNSSQALALWGQRGWNTGDGVFKVFHHEGIVAGVTFNFGRFTPLEVEGLTLESVAFTRREAVRPLRLADVPARVFSEVMRDMDLVVSVAHRGGVDPEASASTVEMRSSLVRETCRLLGLSNVRLKGAHVLVDGDLSNYSIHLGSGTVHQMPGGTLCVVPVHAQHRGRLFLPFADDDPRTAEVLSKVLLFAKDKEIQDPGILEQVRR